MLTAPRVLLLTVLLLAGLLAGCGGDEDDDGGEATPTRTPAASRLTNTPEPTGVDQKTPGPEERPDGETPNETDAPVLTPAAEGTPAVAPSNQTEFVQQFSGRGVVEEDCRHNPSTRVTDCGSRGLFAVDPPPGGEDVSCTIGILEGNPVYIRCVSQQPLQAIYYDVQG